LHEKVLVDAAAEEADRHYVEDPWEQLIRVWLKDEKKEFTTSDVLAEAVRKPKGDWTRADEMRVGRCLRRIGWKRGKQIGAGERRGQRPFVAPSDA
jgi:putative DNA primase/helicase